MLLVLKLKGWWATWQTADVLPVHSGQEDVVQVSHFQPVRGTNRSVQAADSADGTDEDLTCAPASVAGFLHHS